MVRKLATTGDVHMTSPDSVIDLVGVQTFSCVRMHLFGKITASLLDSAGLTIEGAVSWKDSALLRLMR